MKLSSKETSPSQRSNSAIASRTGPTPATQSSSEKLGSRSLRKNRRKKAQQQSTAAHARALSAALTHQSPLELVVPPGPCLLLPSVTFFLPTTSITLPHYALFGLKKLPYTFAYFFWIYPVALHNPWLEELIAYFSFQLGIRETPLYLISKPSADDPKRFLYRIWVDIDNALQVQLDTIAPKSVLSLTPHHWSHVCVQFNLSGPENSSVEVILDAQSVHCIEVRDPDPFLSCPTSLLLGNGSTHSTTSRCPLSLVSSMSLMFDSAAALSQLQSIIQTSRPHYPVRSNSLPLPLATRPLYSFSQLLNWTPERFPDQLNCAWVPLRPRAPLKPDPARQRLILCHDMKGGYLGDHVAQGCDTFLSYTFTRWSAIDMFIYFSHHRLSIPPATWINAAHRNGVPVLGTLITEGDVGYEENALLLDTPPETIAERLVSLAVYYGFDGWFFNIESKLRPDGTDSQVLSKDARKMCALLRVVTEAVHRAVPNGIVLWYDSVTTSGTLRWQNELNRSNQCYFDSCDGIFLNYNWNPDMAQRSAALAGTRAPDVYVGTDVFGRGTYGGGGFDSYKGVKAAHAKGASAAIFAPGWTLECEAAGDDFLYELAEARLWDGKMFEKIALAQQNFQTKKSGGQGWSRSTDSFLPSGDECAITSSDWCTRAQEIDLYAHGLTAADDFFDIIVAEKYKGTPPNCADRSYLLVELRDKDRVVVAKFHSGELTASAEWQTVWHSFRDCPSSVRYLYWEDGGRDAENWAGHYGTKIDMPRVYLACSQSSPAKSINAHHPLPAALPFVTSFCTGRGHAFFVKGEKVRDGDWYNMSYQDPQTTYHDTRVPAQNAARIRCDLAYDMAVEGGSCLCFRGACATSTTTEFRLFEWPFAGTSSPVSIAVVLSRHSDSHELDLVLFTPAQQRLILSAKPTDGNSFSPVSSSSHGRWLTLRYELPQLPPIAEIRVVCRATVTTTEYDLRLGQLSIAKKNLSPSPLVSQLKATQIWIPLSADNPEQYTDVNLTWTTAKAEVAYSNVFLDSIFQGRAYSECFYVRQLPKGTHTADVQPVNTAGEANASGQTSIALTIE